MNLNLQNSNIVPSRDILKNRITTSFHIYNYLSVQKHIVPLRQLFFGNSAISQNLVQLFFELQILGLILAPFIVLNPEMIENSQILSLFESFSRIANPLLAAVLGSSSSALDWYMFGLLLLLLIGPVLTFVKIYMNTEEYKKNYNKNQFLKSKSKFLWISLLIRFLISEVLTIPATFLFFQGISCHDQGTDGEKKFMSFYKNERTCYFSTEGFQIKILTILKLCIMAYLPIGYYSRRLNFTLRIHGNDGQRNMQNFKKSEEILVLYGTIFLTCFFSSSKQSVTLLWLVYTSTTIFWRILAFPDSLGGRRKMELLVKTLNFGVSAYLFINENVEVLRDFAGYSAALLAIFVWIFGFLNNERIQSTKILSELNVVEIHKKTKKELLKLELLQLYIEKAKGDPESYESKILSGLSDTIIESTHIGEERALLKEEDNKYQLKIQRSSNSLKKSQKLQQDTIFTNSSEKDIDQIHLDKKDPKSQFSIQDYSENLNLHTRDHEIQLAIDFMLQRYIQLLKLDLENKTLIISFIYFLLDFTSYKNQANYQIKKLELMELNNNELLSLMRLKSIITSSRGLTALRSTGAEGHSSGNVEGNSVEKLESLSLKALNDRLMSYIQSSCHLYSIFWQTMIDDNPKITKVERAIENCAHQIQLTVNFWEANSSIRLKNMPVKKMFSRFYSQILNQRKKGKEIYLEYVNCLRKVREREKFKFFGVNLEPSGQGSGFQAIHMSDKPILILKYSAGKKMQIEDLNLNFSTKLRFLRDDLKSKRLKDILTKQQIIYLKKIGGKFIFNQQKIEHEGSNAANKERIDVMNLKRGKVIFLAFQQRSNNHYYCTSCTLRIQNNYENKTELNFIITLNEDRYDSPEAYILSNKAGKLIGYSTGLINFLKTSRKGDPILSKYQNLGDILEKIEVVSSDKISNLLKENVWDLANKNLDNFQFEGTIRTNKNRMIFVQCNFLNTEIKDFFALKLKMEYFLDSSEHLSQMRITGDLAEKNAKKYHEVDIGILSKKHKKGKINRKTTGLKSQNSQDTQDLISGDFHDFLSNSKESLAFSRQMDNAKKFGIRNHFYFTLNKSINYELRVGNCGQKLGFYPKFRMPQEISVELSKLSAQKQVEVFNSMVKNDHFDNSNLKGEIEKNFELAKKLMKIDYSEGIYTRRLIDGHLRDLDELDEESKDSLGSGADGGEQNTNSQNFAKRKKYKTEKNLNSKKPRKRDTSQINSITYLTYKKLGEAINKMSGFNRGSKFVIASTAFTILVVLGITYWFRVLIISTCEEIGYFSNMNFAIEMRSYVLSDMYGRLQEILHINEGLDLSENFNKPKFDMGKYRTESWLYFKRNFKLFDYYDKLLYSSMAKVSYKEELERVSLARNVTMISQGIAKNYTLRQATQQIISAHIPVLKLNPEDLSESNRNVKFLLENANAQTRANVIVESNIVRPIISTIEEKIIKMGQSLIQVSFFIVLLMLVVKWHIDGKLHKKKEEFYLTWYKFSDQYMKNMNLKCEIFNEKVLINQLQDGQSIEDSDSFKVNAISSQKESDKKTNDNFFVLRQRKKKGTINPFFSKMKVFLSIILFGLFIIIQGKIQSSISTVQNLTQYSYSIGMNSHNLIMFLNYINAIVATSAHPDKLIYGRFGLNLTSRKYMVLVRDQRDFWVNQSIMDMNINEDMTEYVKKIMLNNPCPYFNELRNPEPFEPLAYPDCEGFDDGILKMGMHTAIGRFAELSDRLQVKLKFSWFNRDVKWPFGTPCKIIPGLSIFHNNLRCLYLSDEIMKAKLIFRNYISRYLIDENMFRLGQIDTLISSYFATQGNQWILFIACCLLFITFELMILMKNKKNIERVLNLIRYQELKEVNNNKKMKGYLGIQAAGLVFKQEDLQMHQIRKLHFQKFSGKIDNFNSGKFIKKIIYARGKTAQGLAQKFQKFSGKILEKIQKIGLNPSRELKLKNIRNGKMANKNRKTTRRKIQKVTQPIQKIFEVIIKGSK